MEASINNLPTVPNYSSVESLLAVQLAAQQAARIALLAAMPSVPDPALFNAQVASGAIDRAPRRTESKPARTNSQAKNVLTAIAYSSPEYKFMGSGTYWGMVANEERKRRQRMAASRGKKRH